MITDGSVYTAFQNILATNTGDDRFYVTVIAKSANGSTTAIYSAGDNDTAVTKTLYNDTVSHTKITSG